MGVIKLQEAARLANATPPSMNCFDHDPRNISKYPDASYLIACSLLPRAEAGKRGTSINTQDTFDHAKMARFVARTVAHKAPAGYRGAPGLCIGGDGEVVG